MKIRNQLYVVMVASLMLTSAPAWSVPVTVIRKAAAEALEATLKRAPSKVMKEMLQESPESVAKVIKRYGDDGVRVLDAHGWPAMKVLLEASDDTAAPLLRMMQKYGDDAVHMAQSSIGRRILATESDEMITAMARTRGQGYALISRHGEGGARALNKLEAKSQHRLIQLHGERRFTEADFDRMLDVIEKYGDRALQFIWKHKKTLVFGAVLAKFLNNPEPFLDVPLRLIKEVLLSVIDHAAAGVRQVASGINWNMVAGIGLGLFGLRLGAKIWSNERKNRKSGTAPAS